MEFKPDLDPLIWVQAGSYFWPINAAICLPSILSKGALSLYPRIAVSEPPKRLRSAAHAVPGPFAMPPEFSH